MVSTGANIDSFLTREDTMDKKDFQKLAIKHPKEILQPFDAIMEMHGFDVVCSLIEQLGGSTVYIPSMRKVFSRCIEEEALKELHCGNVVAVSKKYGYTDRHMRLLLSKYRS
jgi:Mor family transcriptional regulator